MAVAEATLVTGSVDEPTIKLAVFDVDGTLLRGDTVCQAIARGIGKYERMCELEEVALGSREIVIAARQEMAGWYRAVGEDVVRASLSDLSWAPGIGEGFTLLKEAGVKVALASMTWKFAVGHIAERFAINEFVGTDLDFESGKIIHSWGDTKANFLKEMSKKYDVSLTQIAAIGDTSGDYDMLKLAGKGVFVGKNELGIDGVIHMPDADIRDVASVILGRDGR